MRELSNSYKSIFNAASVAHQIKLFCRKIIGSARHNRFEREEAAEQSGSTGTLNQPAAVEVLYFTDPFCGWSWALEPTILKLKSLYREQIRFRFVLPGHSADELAALHGADFRHKSADRDFRQMYPTAHLALCWRRIAQKSEQPFYDFYLRINPNPHWSTLSACQAVKAVFRQNQRLGERFLREMRIYACSKGLNVSSIQTIKAVAAKLEGLNQRTFELNLNDDATVELIERDRELNTRYRPVRYPTLIFRPLRSEEDLPPSAGLAVPQSISGVGDFARYRRMLNQIAPALWEHGAPSAVEALRNHKSLTTAELAAICSLTVPEARRQLQQLETAKKVRRVPVVRGEFWESSTLAAATNSIGQHHPRKQINE